MSLVAVGVGFYSEMSQRGKKCQGHGGKSLCRRRGQLHVERRPKSEILPYYHFKCNLKLHHIDKEWCNSLHMTWGVDQKGSKDRFLITKAMATKPDTPSLEHKRRSNTLKLRNNALLDKWQQKHLNASVLPNGPPPNTTRKTSPPAETPHCSPESRLHLSHP